MKAKSLNSRSKRLDIELENFPPALQLLWCTATQYGLYVAINEAAEKPNINISKIHNWEGLTFPETLMYSFEVTDSGELLLKDYYYFAVVRSELTTPENAVTLIEKIYAERFIEKLTRKE